MERQQAGDRGVGIDVAAGAGGLADQLRDDVGAAAIVGTARGRFQIGQAAEADDMVDADRVHGVKDAGPGKLWAGCQPQGEMPACRMPDRDDPSRVEMVLRCVLSQQVRRSGGILKGAGIAAARAVDAAIVDVPDRYAVVASGQVRGWNEAAAIAGRLSANAARRARGAAYTTCLTAIALSVMPGSSRYSSCRAFVGCWAWGTMDPGTSPG